MWIAFATTQFFVLEIIGPFLFLLASSSSRTRGLAGNGRHWNLRGGALVSTPMPGSMPETEPMR